MNKKSKGFTIIELLVVVAIIAVLASIVLVNVTSYIAKGKDASIKANLATVRTNAAVFYDNQNPSTYAGFAAAGCVVTGSDTLFTTPRAAIVNAGGTVDCAASTASAWCAKSTLYVSGSWCVDSTGFSGAPAAGTDCTSADLTCQ